MFDYRDRHPYTKENPCVGKNICLEHVLQKQRTLTYLNVVGSNADRPMYYFVDTQGYVYTSIEDSSDEARMDMLETLSFYGFTPPKTVESPRDAQRDESRQAVKKRTQTKEGKAL